MERNMIMVLAKLKEQIFIAHLGELYIKEFEKYVHDNMIDIDLMTK